MAAARRESHVPESGETMLRSVSGLTQLSGYVRGWRASVESSPLDSLDGLDLDEDLVPGAAELRRDSDHSPLWGSGVSCAGGGASSKASPVAEAEEIAEADEGTDPNYRVKVFVFFAFSLGVQAFMSYSGGATPASLPAILAANPDMTQFEQSLLGSLDKIGQVIASPLWGLALQKFPTKCLLVLGLFFNTVFSLAFGFVSSKYMMFIAKFIQGCTESQQIIWGNVWTATQAPRHLLSIWMNLGGVAAGLGTALGQGMAGFSIQGGMPYCFSYSVQAGALGLLWLLLLFVPSRHLCLPSQPALDGEDVLERQGGNAGLCGRLGLLARRRLYLLTLLCIAENNFIVGGLQFFWTRFFCDGPWTLDLGTVTLAGLLVQGVGMGLGIFLGPLFINRLGGYDDDLGRFVTLHMLVRFTSVATFGAGLAVLAIGVQLSAWHEGAEMLDGSLRNPWVWTFFIATVPINFALSAQGGVQTVINIGSVPQGMQEFAQGLTTSFQFLCGYAGGVILPSIVLDAAYNFMLAWRGYRLTEADQLAIGVLVLLSMCAVLLLTVALARREARKVWLAGRGTEESTEEEEGSAAERQATE